jgi:hypothetical protein
VTVERTKRSAGRTFKSLQTEIGELKLRIAQMKVRRRSLEFKLSMPTDAAKAGFQQCLSWYVGTPTVERIVVLQPSVASLMPSDGDGVLVTDDKGRCPTCHHKDDIPPIQETAKKLAEALRVADPTTPITIAILPIGAKLQVFELTRPADEDEDKHPAEVAEEGNQQ